MNKYFYVLSLITFMLFQLPADAQLLNIKFGSDALVESAIKDAVVVVESKYYIRDTETNQKYGREGKPYFNTVDFLGCKTDKGVITNAKVLCPWNADKMYDKYIENPKYQPQLDNMLVARSVAGDTIVSIDLNSNIVFDSDSVLICAVDVENRADGLSLSSGDNESINWIVWVNKSTEDESTEMEYYIYKQTVDLTNGAATIENKIPANSFLGGLYIKAKVVSIGLVEFSLSGFIVNKDGRWIVEPVNADTLLPDNRNKDEEAKRMDRPMEELTPLV